MGYDSLWMNYKCRKWPEKIGTNGTKSKVKKSRDKKRDEKVKEMRKEG